MNCSDVELLETGDDVNGGLHCCVGGRLITICLNLHASCNSSEGLSPCEIGDMDEGIVPGGKDVADGENIA